MHKRLSASLLLAVLIGSLSLPVLAATPQNEGEVLIQVGQDSLILNEWYLALLLWQDIPVESSSYPQVKEQFERLRQRLNSSGQSLEQALSAKMFTKAQQEADKGYLVSALYFLEKVDANSEEAYQAQFLNQQWMRQLRQQGIDYQAQLRDFTREYHLALQSWEQNHYVAALRKLRAIQPDSPFYVRARAILRYARTQLANLPNDLLDERFNEPEIISRPETPQLIRPRSLALGIQGRAALPLGESFAGGGGLGLSWYPFRQMALHLEANAFPILNNVSWYVPLTLRYVQPVNQDLDLFAGAGGFWAAAGNRDGLGLLGELGLTWALNSHFALEAGLDYGVPMSTGLNQHTAGLRLGLLTIF